MSEKKQLESQETQNGISLPELLDRVTLEINAHVISAMQSTGIPPEIMIYILKSVLLDLTEMKLSRVPRKEGENHGTD